ncbi:MAG: DUF2817 domain-containing protein [Candidatus Melainabacteria bacterium]|nr:DUF2817 domain-containing protein [Candidatus Melainabacteria bacterium]
MPLGRSVEGRLIHCRLFLPIPNPEPVSGADHNPEVTVVDTLFVGVFHGDEGISGELMNYWCQWLEQHASELGRSIAVIPTLNPDGLARLTRTNARGVDLNRNFPTPNWEPGEPNTPYYGGATPSSEPETQLLINWMAHYQPRKVITVHSPYRVVNYDGPPEAAALAEAMAQANGYPAVASIGYPTPGSFGTYAGIEQQRLVITLELPEEEPIETVWVDNLPALQAAVRF